MVLNLQIEIITENVLVPGGHVTCDLGTSTQNGLRDLSTQTGCGDDQSLAVLLQKMLVDAGPGKDATSTHPTQVTDAGELDQISITDLIFRQNDEVISLLFLRLGIVNRTVDHIHLIADNRLEISSFAQLEQLNGAIHDPVIGESDGRHPKLLGSLNHRRQLRRPIQEAVVTVVVERDECHTPSLGPNARSSVHCEQSTPDVVLRAPMQPRDAPQTHRLPVRTGGPPAAILLPPAHCQSTERQWADPTD